MKDRRLNSVIAIAVFTLLTGSTSLAAQDATAPPNKAQHHHYKLIVLGTLGGPQSYGDAGHGAANINNPGTAAGVADTSTPDPFFPNFNPLFSPPSIGMYPLVYHAFTTRGDTLVDLGGLPLAGLPRGGDSNPTFITENGLVSGQALNGSIDPITGWPAQDPVLWKNGQIINLGSLGGYEGGTMRVNSHGQVAGFTTNAVPDPFSIVYYAFYGFSNGTQTRAFLWDEKRGIQDLGTLGGPDAFAASINESGQVAGNSYTTATGTSGHPFLWENGKMIDLGTLGGTGGFSTGLNNRGQVIGNSSLTGDVIFNPFLWTAPGPMRDLGTPGAQGGDAAAINDAGEVVGIDFNSGHGFLWRNGTITDLGTLHGDCASGAFGINAHTQVVGQSFTCDGVARAFMWENGTMIDLNVFVPPGVNLTLVEVEQINDPGEMFGIGTLADGNSRAFLLIPCDENHPNIEGCDYSLVDASATASVSSMLTTRLSPDSIRQLMQSAGRRSKPWYRGFGAQTQPK